MGHGGCALGELEILNARSSQGLSRAWGCSRHTWGALSAWALAHAVHPCRGPGRAASCPRPSCRESREHPRTPPHQAPRLALRARLCYLSSPYPILFSLVPQCLFLWVYRKERRFFFPSFASLHRSHLFTQALSPSFCRSPVALGSLGCSPGQGWCGKEVWLTGQRVRWGQCASSN